MLTRSNLAGVPKPRHPLLATRCPPETKAAFDALAASRQQSASALLLAMIENVVGKNAAPAPPAEEDEGITGRMSVRLRAGDRGLLNARAAQRGMKAAGYLAMLAHAHARGQAPLPLQELNQLKSAVGELSAVGRNLNQLARAANAGQAGDAALANLLDDVQSNVAELREQVAALVRVNLESWEAGDA